MKKSLLIFAAVALSGCGEYVEPSGSTRPQQTRDGERTTTTPIWTDPETGCDYLMPTGYASDGFMPRTAPDGFHVLCAEQKAALAAR